MRWDGSDADGNPSAKPWLAAAESIITSTWAITDGPDAALVIDDDSQFTSKVGIVWLSGGTAGEDYVVTNTISTDQGRAENRSLLIQVRDR